MKINTVKTVVYAAVNFITGLTDLVLTVRKPDGTIVTPSPTVTEQGDGIYTASYTPDALGTWQEKFSSVVNGDKVFRSFTVEAIDLSDVNANVDDVETKVDTANGKLDALQTTADSIETKVDALDLETYRGGYFC